MPSAAARAAANVVIVGMRAMTAARRIAHPQSNTALARSGCLRRAEFAGP